MSISTHNIATLGWILNHKGGKGKCLCWSHGNSDTSSFSPGVGAEATLHQLSQGWVPGSPAFPQVLMGLTCDGIWAHRRPGAGGRPAQSSADRWWCRCVSPSVGLQSYKGSCKRCQWETQNEMKFSKLYLKMPSLQDPILSLTDSIAGSVLFYYMLKKVWIEFKKERKKEGRRKEGRDKTEEEGKETVEICNTLRHKTY